MSLFRKILGETVDFARFVADDISSHAAIREVRREHDRWMREDAVIGQPYWTVKPAIPTRNDLPWTFDIHGGPYVFTGPAGFGLPNQLKTTSGMSTSWGLWWEHGPLTPIPQQTSESYHQANMPAHERGMAAMRQAVNAGISPDWTDTMQQLRTKYPASAKLLAEAGSR